MIHTRQHAHLTVSLPGCLRDCIQPILAQDALWAQGFGGAGLNRGLGIAVDTASGTAHITGRFRDNMDVVLANGTTVTLNAAGDNVNRDDVFVIKLDSAGGALWARNFGGNDTDEGYGIAVDPASGASYITGFFQGTMNVVLANGTTATLTSAINGINVFVIKLDSAGGALWARGFGGTGLRRLGYGVAVDPASGASYITGAFRDTMNVVLANGTTVTLNSTEESTCL